MSCSGDHHHFTARATACDCAKTTSNLISNLPYPHWTLDESTRYGTRYSNFAQATDPRTNRTYLVREFFADPVAAPQHQRRHFINTAKSLRAGDPTVPPAQQLLYAYTRNNRLYTVADPPQGTPLFHLTLPGRTAEPDTLARLNALLTALHQLHIAGANAGPLFHANLRPETILATEPGPNSPLNLPHALYLENQLREHPLPPEHFQQQDLQTAADAALTLAQGFGSPADRHTRLGRISDPLLGAALEYLYGLHNARPNTAKAALDYLHLLQTAAETHNHTLFAQARTLSPSPRLLRLATAPPPAPPKPTPPPPPPPPPPRPQPTAPPPPQPPPFHPPPYAPVAPPPAADKPVTRPGQPTPKRRSGCGGCLLTLLLALLVAAAIATILLNRPQTSTTLNFSANPNPAPRRTRAELHWTSSGFEHVELHGKGVDPNGSLFVIANTPHHYILTGIRPNGTREIRTLDLSILNRRPPKPSPGTALLPPSQDSTPDDIPKAATNPSELQQVNAALGQWTQAMLSNDPDREAASYAPHLDRYFLQSDVSRDFVRHYLTQVRDGGTTFTQYDISNLLTIPEPDGSVQARFNKEATFATPTGPKHQTTHSVLTLRPIDGTWKITSERDFRGRTPAP